MTPASKSISSSSSEPDASVALNTILSPSVSSNNCPELTVDVELFNSYFSVVALYVRTSPFSWPVVLTSSKNLSWVSPDPAPDICNDAICCAMNDLKLSNSFLIEEILSTSSLTWVLLLGSSRVLTISWMISPVLSATLGTNNSTGSVIALEYISGTFSSLTGIVLIMGSVGLGVGSENFLNSSLNAAIFSVSSINSSWIISSDSSSSTKSVGSTMTGISLSEPSVFNKLENTSSLFWSSGDNPVPGGRPVLSETSSTETFLVSCKASSNCWKRLDNPLLGSLIFSFIFWRTSSFSLDNAPKNSESPDGFLASSSISTFITPHYNIP